MNKSKSPKRKAVIVYNKQTKRKRTNARVPAAQYFPARPETKSLDLTAFNKAITSTASFTLLNGMIPGTGLQNHVGRKISLKSLAFRGMIYQNQAGTASSFDYLRCILFYDRQPSGTGPAFSDVLQDVDQAGTGTSNSMSGMNLANADRFKILRDWFFKVDAPASASVGGSPAQNSTDFQKDWSFKTFVNLQGYETHFNGGSAGTIADITTGSLYLMVVGQQSGSASQYAIQASTRLRYYDA